MASNRRELAPGEWREKLISVVDDDASVLGALESLLTSAGYSVEVFGSAEVFLESGRLAETNCLLLDLRMPGTTGGELFSRIAARDSIPIIIITAGTDDDERERLLGEGALAVLTKPFRPAELLLTVSSALDRRTRA
jgi:FixJ family two-component response regulator